MGVHVLKCSQEKPDYREQKPNFTMFVSLLKDKEPRVRKSTKVKVIYYLYIIFVLSLIYGPRQTLPSFI